MAHDTAQSSAGAQAWRIVTHWLHAFSDGDVDGITALYAPDAVFIGTSSTALVNDAAGVRAYFAGVFTSGRTFATHMRDVSVVELSPASVIISALDSLVATADGKLHELRGRVSFVLAQRDAGWKIVHFHRSALPG